MELFDKLNQVAKNLGDKTSDVIDTTRLPAGTRFCNSCGNKIEG